MARFFLFLLGLVLFGVGILTGGCSVLFTPSLFGKGEFEGSGFLPIWGVGVLLGVGGIWLGIKAFRAAFRDDEAPAGVSQDPPPKDPPEGTP